MTRTEYMHGHTFADILNEHSVVVDLGSHVGACAEEFIKKYGCTVHSVEAVPEIYEKIRETEQLKKYHYAITKESGTTTLYLPNELCATTHVSSKLGDTKIRVPAIRLDEFLRKYNIEKIDLLKLDIEGSELEVFETMSGDELKHVQQITVEFHDFLYPETHARVEAVKKKITQQGFYCIPFSRNNGDVLFIKKDMLPTRVYIYWKYGIKYIHGIGRILHK